MITNHSRDGGTAVVFRDVVKVYHPDVRALDGVSFDIRRGETVALLGPNGAGKSTAIDTMLGLRTQTSGEVQVLGGTPAAAVAHGKIGGMLQTSGLPEAAKVGELVGLFRQLYGGARSQRELLALAGLTDLAGRGVGKLSGGQIQRVRFALALAGAGPALPRRADGGAGRGGAAALLAVAADHRRRGHHGAVRHPLPGRGGRERQPDHRGQPGPGDRRRHAGRYQGQHLDPHAAGRHTGPGPGDAAHAARGGRRRVQGDGVTIRTTDADATLHAWYGLGRPIHGLEIGGGGLEEALLALTGTGGPGQEAGAETGAGAVASPADAAPPHADTVLSSR